MRVGCEDAGPVRDSEQGPPQEYTYFSTFYNSGIAVDTLVYCDVTVVWPALEGEGGLESSWSLEAKGMRWNVGGGCFGIFGSQKKQRVTFM